MFKITVDGRRVGDMGLSQDYNNRIALTFGLKGGMDRSMTGK